MEFVVAPWRFTFRATDDLYFPAGKSGNVFRGALGATLRRLACLPDCPGAKHCPRHSECAYSRFFEPVLDTGPSGLADPPRPFVLRPQFSGGRKIPAGSPLCLDLHLFGNSNSFLPLLIAAFSDVAQAGLGPGRGRADLVEVSALDLRREPLSPVSAQGRIGEAELPPPLRIPLAGPARGLSRIRVEFTSPTELKVSGEVAARPEFAFLVARLRDRIGTLDRLYGAGAVTLDWRALVEQAGEVRIIASALHQEHVDRRSSRTGQTHPLGGFLGWVDYEGALDRFSGLLHAGEWTGVGRQTVWGKGAFRVDDGG